MATVKELEKNKVELSFEISEDQLKEASVKAYHKNKGKFNVPGFRKGHAPKAVLERYYGDNLFLEDAFDIAFPEAYKAAVEEKDLFVVSRPENINIVSMEPGKPMTVSAEVYLKPEVELGAYKGVKVEFKEEKLAEDAVEKDIEAARERNARYEDADREAKTGDRVVIDYSGSVDGEKFNGGTAEAQTLNLGSGTFIPGFEEQVAGMKAGEKKEIHVTFPEDYREKTLAGKAAVFEVTLGAVKEKQLPEADDDFAQDVSDFDTLEEYKADLQKKLEKRNEERNKARLENAVIEKIVTEAKVEIPAPMVDAQIESQLQEMAYNLAYQGMSMEQYCQYAGTTMEQMKEELRAPSEQRVKTQLVLQAIKDAEKIEASEEAVNEIIKGFAEAQNKELDAYKEAMEEEELDYIKNRAEYEALGDFLVKSAKVVAPKAKKAE